MAAKEIPFPALSPTQRLHLDIYGYVIVKDLFEESLIDTLLNRISEIEARYRETGELPAPSCHFSATQEDYFRVDNLPHLDSVFFKYLTHPRILGMVEEIVGGEVRLEQSDAHIRRPVADPKEQQYGFHRGVNPGFSYTKNGLYHFTFVKTLTNLTDLGPEDGGTAVIPGSHKITTDVEQQAIIDAALQDPELIHQVVAPAGSTLLFFESLIHSSGIIQSNRDRVLIIGGYTPTMFQTWKGYEPDPEFVQSAPEEFQPLLTGSARYRWERKLRSLEMPLDE